MKMSYIALIASSAILGACSGPLINSTRLTDNIVEAKSGVLYALPKDLVKVTYKREPLDVKALKKELDAAIAALKEATENHTVAKKESEKLKALIENVDQAEDGAAELLTKLNQDKLKADTILKLAEAKMLTADRSQQEKQNQYDLAISAAAGQIRYTESMQMEVGETIHDPAHRYIARVQLSGRHSEQIKISVKDGYLAGAVGSSDDKTADIATAIASTLLSAYTGAADISGIKTLSVIPVTVPAPQDNCKTDKSKVQLIRTIDPDNAQELADLNAKLKNYCLKLVPEMASTFLGQHTALAKSTKDISGFVYRDAGTYIWKIERTDPGYETEMEGRRLRLSLAQGGPIAYLPMPKGSLTKNTYDLAFDQGRLTHTDTNNPSQWLAAAMIVPNIIRGIFALPTELIQLKVNLGTQQSELEAAKLSLLQAQLELDKQKLINQSFDSEAFKNQITIEDYIDIAGDGDEEAAEE